MGTFLGHIDGGIFFILLAVWWTFVIYRNYIKSITLGTKYRSEMSYDVHIGKRRIPLEIYLKIAFPFIGFLLEIHTDPHFIDEDGNFRKLAELLHMSIYAMFVLHGLSDLCRYKRWPNVDGMPQYSLAMAFLWYGYSFYHHSAQDMHKPPLENLIHRLPIPVMMLCAVVLVIETSNRENVAPQLVRTFCVLTLGTWFTHASFILYLPSPFPGSRPNPAYDRSDDRNLHFMVANFGFHLNLNFAFMLITFIVMKKLSQTGFSARRLITSRPFERLKGSIFGNGKSACAYSLVGDKDVEAKENLLERTSEDEL